MYSSCGFGHFSPANLWLFNILNSWVSFQLDPIFNPVRTLKDWSAQEITDPIKHVMSVRGKSLTYTYVSTLPAQTSSRSTPRVSSSHGDPWINVATILRAQPQPLHASLPTEARSHASQKVPHGQPRQIHFSLTHIYFLSLPGRET